MDRIEVGQELEFIQPAHVNGQVIEAGTRVRVGFVETDIVEPKVTVVLIDTDPPQTLTLPRHVLGIHCRVVPKRA